MELGAVKGIISTLEIFQGHRLIIKNQEMNKKSRLRTARMEQPLILKVVFWQQ